ncbi:MAG: DUF1846 domain-containing protein [Collinsella aerofaciens]
MAMANGFVETTRPLVVVTAPSWLRQACHLSALSRAQTWHGRRLCKFEFRFGICLTRQHCLQAATADLDDANIIDSFHLEAYNKTTVNYNRDVEAFPVVRPHGEDLGRSLSNPTDMGVNMVGFAIIDDDACRDASRWRSSAATLPRSRSCAVLVWETSRSTVSSSS